MHIREQEATAFATDNQPADPFYLVIGSKSDSGSNPGAKQETGRTHSVCHSKHTQTGQG